MRARGSTRSSRASSSGCASPRRSSARVDPALRWHARVDDGSYRETGLVAEVAGPARSLLTGERTALNFMQRLSGVATLTARYVAAVGGHQRARYSTRARRRPACGCSRSRPCVAGGGTDYRTGLYDAILVKENHAALAGGVGEATRIALAEGEKRGVPVEVECATLDEVARRARRGRSTGCCSTTCRSTSCAPRSS